MKFIFISIILTKIHSISGTLMAVGDVFSQTLVEKKKFKEMDPVRIARFGAMGVVFMVKNTSI
jgi:hypothetical protein